MRVSILVIVILITALASAVVWGVQQRRECRRLRQQMERFLRSKPVERIIQSTHAQYQADKRVQAMMPLLHQLDGISGMTAAAKHERVVAMYRSNHPGAGAGDVEAAIQQAKIVLGTQ